MLVGPTSRHGARCGERLVGRAAAVLSGLRFTYSQLRMLAAAPVDCQDHFTRRVVDIGDNVDDEGAQKLLTRPHRDVGRVPCGVEVLGKAGKIGSLHCGERFRRLL